MLILQKVGNIGHTGNGGSPPSLFPDAEGRTQFALWCILKSPLLLGTFIHNITDTPQTLATVTNAAAIAVNQDALGEQGVLRKSGGYMPDKPRPTSNTAFGFQIWSGALANNSAAAVLANLQGNTSQPLTLTNDEMPPSRQAVSKWDILEAFSGKKMAGVVLPVTTSVAPHDVAMWVLTPAAPAE
jgi:alpha-galactosidase